MKAITHFFSSGKRALALSAVAALVGFSGASQANTWPNKPIKFIVCFPPGNAADVFAREIGPLLSAKLGQPVVVENKPGAGGMLGVDAVAKSTADGYTFGACSLSPITILPAVRTKMPYDVNRDIEPVVLTNKGPMVLVVKKDAPFNSLNDLIKYTKDNPGKLNYASLGPGTISQMSMEAFKMASGTDLTEVSYKGSGPALIDLVGGHINVMLDGAASVSTLVAAGTVKALAVTTQKRTPLLPQVPSMSESDIAGLKSFDFFGWVGFIAPAGTAPEVIARMNREITDILKHPSLQQRAQATGQEIVEANTPAQFRDFIKTDFARWSAVARRLKLEIKD